VHTVREQHEQECYLMEGKLGPEDNHDGDAFTDRAKSHSTRGRPAEHGTDCNESYNQSSKNHAKAE